MSIKKREKVCANCRKTYSDGGKYFCCQKCANIVTSRRRAESMSGKNSRVYIHGMTGTKFHGIWNGIHQRCSCETNKAFRHYGARGISCEWNTFLDFKADMYDDYVKHVRTFGSFNTSLDRIENNGNYCKKNCRWSTRAEQNRNKAGVKLLNIDGEVRSISGWSLFFNIPKRTVHQRIKKGLSFQRALGLPLTKTIKLAKNYYLG